MGGAGSAGAVAPDPGIVEDRGGGAELSGEIGRVDPAMRGVDDNRAPGVLFDNSGNAIGNDDRRGERGHRGGLARGRRKIASSRPLGASALAKPARQLPAGRTAKGESRLSPGRRWG